MACNHHHHGDCPDGKHKHPLMQELAHHLPWSVAAVVLSLVALGIGQRVFDLKNPQMLGEVFKFCHGIHILLAATTTTAMFFLYDKSWKRAALMGLLASVPICTLSDVAFPWLGGRMLGRAMTFHVCAFEDPAIVWPCAALGILTGLGGSQIVRRITLYSHGAHVLVSSLASSLYLVAYGLTDWSSRLGWVMILLVAAVMIPCCLSDIVFPLLFVKRQPRKPHPEVEPVDEIVTRKH